MLDRLPPELVDHILDLLIPSPATVDGAHERTIALRAFCLVLKAVRDRAEPLLWRDVAILSWDQGDRALLRFEDADEGTRERLSKTRSLRIGVEGQLFYVEEIFGFLAFFPSLRELRMECEGLLDMGEVARSVPNLETLTLNWAMKLFSSTSFVLPSLTNLSLDRTDMFPSFATNLFASFTSALPSFRAFAFSPRDESTDSRSNDILFDSHSPGFLGRRSTLDMLQLHLEDVEQFSKPVFQSYVPTAMTVTNDSLAQQWTTELLIDRAPSHIRFYPSPTAQTRPDIFVEALQQLGHVINYSSPSPKSLHVPFLLRSEPSERISELRTTLFAACKRKAVEVLWYNSEEEEERAVSPSFWRYARRIKAEKEKETK
ncbi:hypothetical protein JCM8547_005939 [Rhodosporidiobolus lusitaniae]